MKHMSEPWFSLVATGRKVHEGRLGNNSMAKAPIGSEIIFFNDDLPFRREAIVAVAAKKRFRSFREMLSSSKGALEKTLPTVRTVDDGVAVYRQFYTAKSEKEQGVVRISLIKKGS